VKRTNGLDMVMVAQLKSQRKREYITPAKEVTENGLSVISPSKRKESNLAPLASPTRWTCHY
jgi:hypothetical protein